MASTSALECDGAAYHDAEKDTQRDTELKAMGWTVYRAPGWIRDGYREKYRTKTIDGWVKTIKIQHFARESTDR
ncbi:hypothetical protein [Candidatus Glomeribacter gigasporarum]|uniref:hypothetical protein n=1 Tax=Candidatus Glomeribacter gigasporarum TaxID=132144 RepID=UPI0013150E92|nr:hypothetical protein [Candidatus Glomeribacter gigasporarum]